jgi:penicillin-binding protein 2
MSTRERLQTVRMRILVALGAMLLAFGFLIGQLWRIQVIRTDEFAMSLDRQSIRRVRLPGIRGRIYDRHGVVLADNQPVYCVALYTEELRQRGPWTRTINHVDSVIDELSQVLALERQVTRVDIQRHIQRRLPLPFIIWRGLDASAMARWAESSRVFPGVDIYVESERVYPQGTVASHVLGYVGRANTAREAEDPFHYYLPEMAGREGVERSADRRLRGRAGGRLIRVDATGFKFQEYEDLAPVAGENIRLTLDLQIQMFAENVLSNQPGAVVVLDPRNGDVLALASGPAFDRNALSSQASWRALIEDPARPVLNRAISGLYPPGSVFKPLVGLAGLVSDRINGETVFSCPGYYEMGGIKLRCWLRRGHGALNLRSAIEQSCNPYFIETALRTGHSRVYHMADSIGFGRATGIDLPGEAAGLLPDDGWKRRRWNDAWRPGDTANVSIGQGALLVTPLQMAVFVAALANGGRVYHPRLFLADGAPPVPQQQMAWPAHQLGLVQAGMYDAIHGPRGTGRRALLPGVFMAGKTGTAQFGQDQTHAWMILYAPYEAPRYAVAMIVEDDVSGGVTVAPRLRALMEAILQRDGILVPATDQPLGALRCLRQKAGGFA